MGRKPITMAPRMLLAVFVAGVALACAIQPSFEIGAARLERDTSLVVSNLDVESFVDVTEAADVAVVEAVATLLKSDVAAEAYTAVMEGAGASATCGDGMRQGTEECDDGNTLPNDGCNAQCKVEGGYQCLPEKMEGKDTCNPCGDTQCTTVFARQSRCLDTIATKSDGVSTEKKAEPKRVGAQSQQEEQNVPDMVSFLEIMEGAKAGGEGAFMRGASGFCECSVQFCQQTSGGADPLDFTCKSTSKGWARTSVADSTCTCGTGFCSMPLTGNDVGTSHCTPLHANMIRNNATGVCQCRAQTAAVNSSDPLLATLAQEAACKINPVEPVVKVSGGSDKFGTFECVGLPYVKAADSENCASCTATGSCQIDRTQGTGNFLCFAVKNGTAEKSDPYRKKPDGKCECGVDQCLKPKGDHFVCRDLTGAAPYGPTKHADGMCGCSADKDVCRLTVTGGFRCVHMSKDNFAQGYRRSHDGSCRCKFGMCKAANDPATGRLECKSAMPDAPYIRKKDSLDCECKPGSCSFPGGECKACPKLPGQCESHCANTTSSVISCTKFCRTVGITRVQARATAQGQLQSATDTIAREVGCFVEKVTTCTITASSKTCVQKKSAKALYDCPAIKSGKVPMRLSDGTETFGYQSMCGEEDLECQIQNCGRNPDSQKCMPQSMLT